MTTGFGMDFPSFSEGLSLRLCELAGARVFCLGFPFLFGRAFIEAISQATGGKKLARFPFLFGRAFIEALIIRCVMRKLQISLPFRKGFH